MARAPLSYRRRAVIAVASSLAIAVAIILLPSCRPKKSPPPPKEGVPVVVAAVVQKDMPVQLRAVGNIESYSTVSVKTQVSGELTGVLFKEGDFVKRGQLIFTLDQRQFEAELKQAESNLARDIAQLAHAKAQAERYAGLNKDGIISDEQNDLMRTSYDAMEATVAADRAAVANAKVQVTYCNLYSPIDGRTGNLLVHRGNMVKANADTGLVTINQIQPIYATFSVPEAALAEIKREMATRPLIVEAYIPNDPKPAIGKLAFIDNTVDPMTGTIKLKGEFANTDHRLWPGLFTNAVLTLRTQANALLVPSVAIQTGQQGPFVFVVKHDNTVEMRPVKVDRAIESQTVLSSGVQGGERVVIDGQLRLVPGAKVAFSALGGSGNSTATTEQAPVRQGNGS
ncbi:MAG TPA: efflux RND transporter periplasmic adaptor subunit [Terriglobales bacterium]|nr:efflux RND transporter periplasmic adaptor subunit [Terriglobales bacterium]